MTFQSEIYLAKGIKLDRDYNNVLNYTPQQMLSYVQSKQTAHASDYSFIRETGAISVGFDYSKCLEANYIAFQNKNYSNRWFFAWIDSVTYINDGTTELTYTVDSWSTYFNDLDCTNKRFIIRQHALTDVAGDNTIPENLELGDFVINGAISHDVNLEDYVYVCCSTKNSSGQSLVELTSLGGIAMPGYVYVAFTNTGLVNFINSMANHMDSIYAVYLAPKALFDLTQFVDDNPTILSRYEGKTTPEEWLITQSKPTTIDSYSPVNKKLLTYPFNFLNVSNNNGAMHTYKYELSSDGNMNFKVKGVPTIGASIKLMPMYYKNSDTDTLEDEGLIGGKYPTCAWSNDYYTNWLTQQSINVSTGYKEKGLATLGNLAGALISASTGNVALAGLFAMQGVNVATSIGTSVLDNMKQQTLAEMQPDTIRGNVSAGDINTADNCNTFYFYPMSIRSEFARRIDDYFTRFGYAQNQMLIPNITHRAYWNYIQIDKNEEIGDGDIPEKYFTEINNICRKGVTIWHNHANIGNFNLSNTIV